MNERKLSPTQKLTFAAMLLALSIITTLIAKTIPMGNFYYLRFSLTPALIIYTSFTLGPLYGLIVGAAADAIPALIYPTGSYNFLLTIVYGLLGVVPWCLEKGTRHFRSFLRQSYMLYATLAAILVALGLVFYLTPLFDDTFGAQGYWAKPTILAVLALLEIGFVIGLYFTNRYFQKRLLDYPDIPSPNENAFIALISEITLMDAAKALAFWAFYNFLAGEKFPLSYGLVFSMLLIGAPVDVLLITFIDSWLLIFTKRFIHSYGLPISDQIQQHKEEKQLLIDDKSDEGQKALEEQKQKKARIGWFIFFAISMILMIVCIVVIKVIQSNESSSTSDSSSLIALLISRLF
jgi:uncharacterized protein YneF (UPF0154 family)